MFIQLHEVNFCQIKLHGMVWYGMAWLGMAWCCLSWNCMILEALIYSSDPEGLV